MNINPSSPDDKPLRIVIIGAGVAGCIVARTLARRGGVEVSCLERVARDDHSQSGTGLNIGPNAIKMLRAQDPALADAVAAASLPWKSWRTSLTDGTELFCLPLADVADNDGVRIRWSELYRVLRDGAGDAVRYGVAVSDIRRGADGRCSLRYSVDGQTAQLDDIDLLIGADGRYSATRSALSGAPAMRQVGVAIFRLLVPDTAAGLIDDYEQWFNGPHRLLAFRVPPGHIYIAGTFPLAEGAEISAADKSADALRRCYLPAAGAPGAQAAWLIDTLCKHLADIHWARLQETEAGYRDAGAPLLYLGDAAHGMVPTLGQGATQAIEDGCVAAALIAAQLAAGSRDVQQWLRDFEARRSERIRFVMDFSLEASDTLFAGSDPVAGSLKKVQPPFRAKLSRLYRDVGLENLAGVAP
ncbi:MAG: NAD(P)/FAD-dependent oxidoreductase [Noviherbaspirillum sp.]